ncbi:MerR family transcriptional regulator [Paenibacillus spongiae]|uniref:MerR family transcriptional regulator n=1 Tax=Paenibacillus spongiae TaxID=2909671 RepID=A0ABY5SD95_9BACL|nr:MerR family transcriptional regulator [Paenibacillus spongiae]UVI30253.1 MerR family transcriptional regulator [Paenibacillus spongiae]
MKSEITISELAKLMNVSVHQIRYFEEKGILQPAYVDRNQYRMYGMDQVYRLAHILLLRKLGVPVQSIKECITSYSADQLGQLLHRSLLEIDTELLRLQELRQFMNKILQKQPNVSPQSEHYRVKRRDTAYLTRWMEMESGSKLNARGLVERAGLVPDLFESDIHCIEDGSGTLTLYLETQAPGDYSLPEGEYLAVLRLIHEEDELEQAIEQFYDYAAAQSFALIGPLILIERSYLSLFTPDKLHYELQALIEPDEHSGKGARP